MKKTDSFILLAISDVNKDEVELRTMIDGKTCSFLITFTKDNEGNDLGFIFRNDLEMLCRANELSLVRKLMATLTDYRAGKIISFPVLIFTESAVTV